MRMRPFPEDHLTSKEIATIQQRAWKRAFRYAFAHSPFYREHLRRAGFSPKKLIPLERLGQIPTIGKEVLSENPEAFLCVPREQVVDIVTTSGSIGQPMVWMLTDPDMQRLALNEYHSFRCAGLTASDTVVLAVTLDRCFIAGMAYFMGLRMLGCSIVRVGSATPVMHLELLQRTRATAIVGVPSFLGLLADKAAEAGLNLAGLGVRKLICIGEPIRQPDWSLNRAGELLERRWNARVFSTYGNTELAASLCECEAGRGGHLHPALLHVEALDDSGQPVPDGQVGELTATTFGVEAMPLIRYRTGDCAAIFREPCACGRRTLRIGPIVGRKGQKLKFKGTTIFPSTLKAVLDAAPEVQSYVIIARRGSDGSDLVEVRLACAGTAKTILGRLREQFQGAAKVAPELILAAPAEIESLQMIEDSRKRRFFVDLRENGKAGA
jgi:phenylacetate-CoA ligase